MSSHRNQVSGDPVSNDQNSTFIKFCDALFQEQNIKWLLGLGTLILLSSSTMLVTSHWDSYTPLWKYAVLLGYTSLFHVAGQIAYHRLALRKTGTGLMALTVLLIPLSFSAFRWIHPASVLSIDGLFAQSGLLLLLLINSIFSYLAASRIFRHFLVGTQPTFLSSYLLLAVLGAVVPALPSELAPLFAFISWGVFAIGSMKVNRHAFWLAEEHRKPRIFGFFPILLLGIQFLTLFATCLAPHVSFEWMGFGLVMTAIPVLLAADSLVRVIQVRSELEAPTFPASVVVSMIAGVALVIGGVFLSAYHFPATIALVPTSLMAAGVMGLVARRTEKRGFVWLMLLFAVTVYQTSPVFFQELLTRLAQQGATAIGEENLPLAFYGLTYLPFLGVTSILGQWLVTRKESLFAVPLKQFSVVVALALLPLAFFHDKAIFPVCISLGGLFAAQTLLFRDRRLQFAALGAFLAAALGFIPFYASIFDVIPRQEFVVSVWIAVSGLLLFPGRLFDRATKRLPELHPFWNVGSVFASASLVVTVLSTIAWTAIAITDGASSVPGIICLGLLISHAFQFKNTFVSSITLALPIVVALTLTANLGWSFSNQIMLCASLIAGLSISGLILAQKPHWTVTQVFKRASEVVSHSGIFLLQTVFLSALLGGMSGTGEFWPWGAAIIALVAGIEIAWRMRSSNLVILSWMLSLGLMGNVFLQVAQTDINLHWISLIWACFTTVIIVFKQFVLTQKTDRDEATQKCIATFEKCLLVTLALITIVGFPFFTGVMRIAGFVAVSGLFLMTRHTSNAMLKDLLQLVVNCQLLILVIQVCCPEVEFLFNLSSENFAVAILPLSLASVFSATYWRLRSPAKSEIATTAAVGFEFLAATSLLLSFIRPHGLLNTMQAILAAMAFVGLIINQGLLATRKAAVIDLDEDGMQQRTAELHVWLAEGIVLLGTLYFVRFGYVALNSTVGLFVPLLLAGVCWTIANVHSSTNGRSVFRRPLRATAFALPAFTVLIGISQHLFGSNIYWPGLNSLALLFAGGFYFWRGLEDRRTGLLLGSAVTLNLAMAMLWKDLNWSDPQLFLVPVGITVLVMVEFLRTQIPNRLHNPLRYAGALSILVSPTFEIVGGSWVHLITLMVTSIVVVVVAMGIRVKALMYTGTAFLVADLIAIVVRGTIDQPSLLWLAGIAIGAGVIGLAAYCERHREKMLQRLRFLSAELETWQ